MKLTNYRKNGDLFQNLLSMRPVFDMDGIYRYVIGVQFEVVEDENLKQRLVKLDKLLKMLPRKLPMKSRASARAKGQLAAKVKQIMTPTTAAVTPSFPCAMPGSSGHGRG